jgi:hypothetical protein
MAVHAGGMPVERLAKAEGAWGRCAALAEAGGWAMIVIILRPGGAGQAVDGQWPVAQAAQPASFRNQSQPAA